MDNKEHGWHNIPLKEWGIFFIYVVIGIIATIQFIYPFLAERHFRDGYNLHVQKRYKHAINELNEAIRYAPWETHYMIQLGRSKEDYAKKISDKNKKLTLYFEIETLYKHMIELDSQNPWFKNRLAILYTLIGDLIPDKKEKYDVLSHDLHKESSEVDINNPLFQLNYAFYLHQTKDPDALKKAIPYYKRVIEIDDRMLEARYNLADIYRKNNATDAVLKQYLEIYKKNPTFKKISTAIASTYISLKQMDKAIFFIEEAHQQTPQDIEILRNLAGLYYQLKKWPESTRAYEKLFILSPQSKKAIFQFYIQALINSKQLKKAHKELQLYNKKNPNNKEIKKQLKLLEPYIKSN